MILTESSVTDAGRHAAVDGPTRSIFARGEGGFVASAGRQRRSALPDRPCDHEVPLPTCRSRRCCIGCAVTAIRSIPIRNSPPRPAFRDRSCTDCAHTALRARRLLTRASRATSTGCIPTAPTSRASCIPSEMLRARIWEEDDRLLSTRNRAEPRRRGRALRRGIDSGVTALHVSLIDPSGRHGFKSAA